MTRWKARRVSVATDQTQFISGVSRILSLYVPVCVFVPFIKRLLYFHCNQFLNKNPRRYFCLCCVPLAKFQRANCLQERIKTKLLLDVLFSSSIMTLLEFLKMPLQDKWMNCWSSLVTNSNSVRMKAASTKQRNNLYHPYFIRGFHISDTPPETS